MSSIVQYSFDEPCECWRSDQKLREMWEQHIFVQLTANRKKDNWHVETSVTCVTSMSCEDMLFQCRTVQWTFHVTMKPWDTIEDIKTKSITFQRYGYILQVPDNIIILPDFN